MSKSKLVSFTQISPNRNSPRNHKIDTISIHCVVGQLSVETMGHMFAQSSYQASCNYAIGSDGRIALIVDEGDRSWCTSSPSNDNRAITIECASDKTHPYAVNDKVYASLINLLVDICQRNDIKQLLWKADKSLIGQIAKQNMTVHRWFAAKACPGDYLYNRHGQIAAEVNKRLGAVDIPTAGQDKPQKGTDHIWMGWTKRETGKDGLRNIHGDSGKAYGLQFDYRYGLIPFLQFCVEYDSKYAAFKKFIGYGAGSSKLIYNQELGRLWQQFYDADPEEFEQLQYLCAYEQYYLPAKEHVKKCYGINMDNHDPAVKGTLWSMAFRSGSETGAKKFAGCTDTMSDRDILNKVYPTYGTADANRWTKAGQWGDALKALERGDYEVINLKMEPSKPEEPSGTVKEILDTLAGFQAQLLADIKAGKGWIYSNSGCSNTMTTALKKGNRKNNCALLVRMALRKLGLLDSDNWWGEKGGTIIWRGDSEAQMKKSFDIIKIGGKKTVKQMLKDGSLQAGDIVTYVDMGHTNVYAGNGKWYDAGHAYASGSGEGAVFKSWYGDTVHGSQRVGYILRRKAGQKPVKPDVTPTKHIVQVGAYKSRTNAEKQAARLRSAGFEVIVKKDGNQYKVQAGAFDIKTNAENLVRQLEAKGFDAFIK